MLTTEFAKQPLTVTKCFTTKATKSTKEKEREAPCACDSLCNQAFPN
jgi:hypothetical protein